MLRTQEELDHHIRTVHPEKATFNMQVDGFLHVKQKNLCVKAEHLRAKCWQHVTN